MQQDIKVKKECPFDRASLMSRLFFCWMIPLFRSGYQKELDLPDLHKFCAADDPKKVSDALEVNWNKELNRKDPSIIRALGMTFGLRYSLYAMILLVTVSISHLMYQNLIRHPQECVAKTFQPLLIGTVVNYFTEREGFDGEDSAQKAYMAAGAICLSSILETFGRNHYQLLVRRVALNCRTSLTILVYNKILRLSKSSFEKTSVGQILNILANDMNRFDELGHIMIYILIAPIQSIIVMYIMWQYLGIASVGGLVILFLFIPFQGLMGRLFNVFRRKTTNITDKRIKLMGEIISAMKLIKVYCWEGPFADVIAEIREKEIKMMKWSCLLKGTNSALFFVACRIMLFASFMVYIFIGGQLKAETVFVTMALFNAIRLPVTNQFPNAVGLGAESMVACKRIQKILLLDEKPTNNLSKFDTEKGSVILEKYSGKWCKTIDHTNLSNINLEVKPKELVVVIGSVGSGKTCLLHALLNELETVSGSCKLNGKTSYAPQEAWCFGGSIRENIVLSDDFDAKRYNQVIKVCGLERDLQLFPEGDKTFVGEKGYTLSGGQKARVSLARAIYTESDVYLLDDPLSAVDPQVANHIFEKCIREFLKKKTVILVTHQLQFIEKADKIVVLSNGENVMTGSYDEIRRSGVDILTFLENEQNALKQASDDENFPCATPSRKASIVANIPVVSSRSRKSSVSSYKSRNKYNNAEPSSSSKPKLDQQCSVDEMEARDDDSEDGNIIDIETDSRTESRSVGSVKPHVYWDFIRAGASVPFVIFTLFATICPQVIFHYTDLWLAKWTRDYEVPDFERIFENMNGTLFERENGTSSLPLIISNLTKSHVATIESEKGNVITYSILILSLFGAAFIRVICIYLLCLKCSINLHNRIFSRLLRAPMIFFESNPMGRILNRFTRDMGQIDQKVPATVDDLIATLCNVIGIIITSAIVSPYLIIPAIVLAAISVPFRKVYLRTGRDIQRLDAIARSPVYSHIATTYDGLTALRAFGLQSRFQSQYFLYMNDATATRFLVLSTGRAYSFCLDVFALLYICSVCMFLMVFPDGIPGGDVGLVLSQVLVLIGLFQSTVRKTADFETQMVSCERVLEYGNLPSEAPLTYDHQNSNPHFSRKFQSWPDKGSVKFNHVFVSYDVEEKKPVLKDVTFKIKGGEKIGIVGRTGAGKSSLISVLFRLVEPSSGDLIIDNIDTQLLGLHELRNKISIIPQDPVLFSGTVRRNLDPFNEYKDTELWRCLQDANLSSAVTSMTGGLDGKIIEGGLNLSVGQRQLLCLARALLKNNKILVLDEATANVDLETDELIQKTIKTNFSGCTVVTVAHRLNTIIDMDKVLVLDAGRVVEFDEPYNLLSSGRGYFHSMVKQTGDQFSKLLYSLAKSAYYKKRENDLQKVIQIKNSELREKLNAVIERSSDSARADSTN